MAVIAGINAQGLLALFTAVSLGMSAGNVFGQAVPDAGSLLKEMRDQDRVRPPEPGSPANLSTVIRPTIRLPDGATVRVDRFKISGNSAILSLELTPLVAPWEGRTLDVSGLNEAASAITRFYQSRGYLLSYAYLPVQKIDQGIVEIVVLEGRVGGLQVVAAQDVRLDDAVIQQHVGAARTDNAALPARQDDIERRLLLLNDIPGVVARGAFTPGAQPGSSDLVVSVVEDEPLENTFYLNNYGSNSSGEQRLGAQFHLRDIFGIGDSSRLNLSWSSRGQISSGGLTTRVPFGGDGWTVNAGLSHLTYELGGEFTSLGARGEANTLLVGVSYPVLRSLKRNLTLQLDYELKMLRDLIPLIATEDKKTSRSLTAGFNFDDRDGLMGGGRSRASFVFQTGVLALDSGATDVLRKTGAFNKTTFEFSRDQSLQQYGQLYLRLLSQRANKNLDSSEKLGLGGPLAVRAYGPGEAATDESTLITLEYRYLQPLTGATLTWRIFYDRASGRIDYRPLDGTLDNDVTITGSGLGLNWNTGGDFDLALTAAWRGDRLPSVNGDHKPRLYLQLTKGF